MTGVVRGLRAHGRAMLAEESAMVREAEHLAGRLGVTLQTEVPPPVEPMLGIGVTLPPSAVAPAHRLVCIGDSLTQGFQHDAIGSVGFSWPAILARQLGVEITQPHYDVRFGGNPFNLEFLARHLGHGVLADLRTAYGQARKVEEYFGRGGGSFQPDPDGPRNHNLGVWGWDLRDALDRTADTERPLVDPAQFRPGLLPQLPGNAWSAVQVLNSARRDGAALTPFGAAHLLGEDPGGIETLCVWLGSNNVLRSVIDLDVRPSEHDFWQLESKRAYNVWTVPHFAVEYARVAERIRGISARHVLLGTVPHVTIPPVTRGLGPRLQACDRYFSAYGRPWQRDEIFHAALDRHLTGGQAWAIDMVIDGYNAVIADTVRQARQQGLDWRVVDVGAVLDRLAVRRNQAAQRASWIDDVPDPLPPEYAGLTTLFFGSDEFGTRTQGGLFGLDGVHPTTAAYGIVAQAFADVIAGAGVAFAGPGGARVDFAGVLEHDTLNSDPPPRLDRLLRWLRQVDHGLDPLQRVFQGSGKLPV